jgi:Rrf2 family protein
MLSLTRKSDYALVALSYLGQQQGEERAVSARRIADQFGLPLPLLMNILKALSHAGLVTSTRGPQGGYTLAVAPTAISILDVVHAIEGPIRVAMCSPREGDEAAHSACCPAAGMCPIEGPIKRLNQQLQGFLARVTLADLLGPQVDVPLEKVGI